MDVLYGAGLTAALYQMHETGESCKAEKRVVRRPQIAQISLMLQGRFCASCEVGG